MRENGMAMARRRPNPMDTAAMIGFLCGESTGEN